MPKCNALDNHVCVDTDIRFRPCCVFRKRSGNTIEAGGLDWNTYNLTFISDVKTAMETGWHAGCESCKLDEELGKESQRIQYNQLLTGVNNQIEFLDISFANECNLTCKMCGPPASSKWERLVTKHVDLKTYPYYQLNNYANRSVHNIIQSINFKHVTEIKLQGGEPFIGNSLELMLQEIKSKGSLENISLRTSTNCTAFPKSVVADLLKFKRVSIALSIDGIDELCNYIRTGCSWKKVYKVVKKWIELANTNPQIDLNVSFTLQALNLHQFLVVKQWANDHNIRFNFDILKYPTELSIYSLPKDYIIKLKENNLLNDNMIKLLNGPVYDPVKLLALLNMQDSAMKTNIEQTIPMLYNTLINHQ
jgi:sulfatase maturation enzyme AslB (radical SAM superfamily)